MPERGKLLIYMFFNGGKGVRGGTRAFANTPTGLCLFHMHTQTGTKQIPNSNCQFWKKQGTGS